ncbi:proline--tRNA ligase [Hazenella sp. IB182353]|uniref:proline--tRNA ligase n=1 Tax=Polycladospora coralii TaxID=2771432 RepID=UPI001746DF7C|nr:proline--tRNA ligase [Polycladospora coralii]MBS7530448.1 proline--tRNA ligase [Polycladospora coralii]
MRQKHMLSPTLRSVAEAEMMSHQLLLRAGFIRQLAAGIYSFLPLGFKVLHKVETIVREEMDKIGAQEVLLPSLHPSELWEETGRKKSYGPELMQLQDRHGREFVLGPTHEEVITDLLRDEVNSYKKLPISLYQIQSKFRDERRPRSGLLRGREFMMKDAYSFHANRASLDEQYALFYQAYQNIFSRLGLDFRAVEADSGAMGGTDTHEFMALSEAGEDTVAMCLSCEYASNIEMAKVMHDGGQRTQIEVPVLTEIETKGQKTIAEVASFLDIQAEQVVKSLLFIADDTPVLVLIRGDHDINEVKIKNLLGASVIELAEESQVIAVCGAPSGYVGPVGLKKKVKVIADHAVADMNDMVVGANKKDYHLRHVQHTRDFEIDEVADVRNIQTGDTCPSCGGQIQFSRGIEIGHVFKLGTRYSEVMSGTILDENGKTQPYIMGCYGIGISRAVASIVEQHHDENGIIWPASVAPYAIHLIAVNMKNETQASVAEEVYQMLQKEGIEVLFDDRPERAGVKFKDADLFGIPLRITVGSKAGEGIIEYKNRRSGVGDALHLQDLSKALPDLMKELM